MYYNNTIKAGGSTVRAQSMSEWVSGVEWLDTP